MNSKAADEERFLKLVDENQNKILRVCRVYAWNAADQDDLYQDILCQLWRSLATLKDERFANTWLYRVALNTALSFVRRRATRCDRLVQFEHIELTRAIESRQTVEAVPDERMSGLYNAIYQLNPIEKAVVTLFLEDFTYEQIADATGISANNVGVMLHRAKKKLSTLLTQEGPK